MAAAAGRLVHQLTLRARAEELVRVLARLVQALPLPRELSEAEREMLVLEERRERERRQTPTQQETREQVAEQRLQLPLPEEFLNMEAEELAHQALTDQLPAEPEVALNEGELVEEVVVLAL